MSIAIKVAFASGPEGLNVRLVARMQSLYPELPLYVVSEFPCEHGQWVPYSPARSFRDNLGRCRAAFRGKRIRLAGVLLVPRMPYRRMRLMALVLAPRAFLAFNENLDNFMLRPWTAWTILRHLLWRTRNFLWHELHPGGAAYTFFWRLVRPREWRRPLARLGAALGGGLAAWLKRLPRAAPRAPVAPAFLSGISVVIPSRNGRELLERLLPGVVEDLAGFPAEIIVVDNGSEDGTAEFLRAGYPEVILESRPEPLAFAEAANRGIRRARFSQVCLLNNDMVLEPGFFAALGDAFNRVPDLFAATAQIFFPPGARRQETGKAVMPPRPKRASEEFPIRCEWPAPGEDFSYVLYGSGGCTLYSHAKLAQLGGLQELYRPAYVEDLDLGYRAWQRGWPTVFCAGARVTHHHRATTSRYYPPEELARCLELNYLRFLAASVSSPRVFRRLWRDAVRRLDRRAAFKDPAALAALTRAWRAPAWTNRGTGLQPVLLEELILALGSGAVAVFPGKAASSWGRHPPCGYPACRAAGETACATLRPVVLVASP